MIHRDLCDPVNTKYYSPLRMQFHFLLSRFHCWNGFVPLTRKEMAAALSCDIQSVDKFIKKGIQDKILRLEGDRLYLLIQGDQTKGYVKHFPFLESPLFQSLNLHSQRFILYCLWAGVHTGRPLKSELSKLYHSTKENTGRLNLYSRELLPTVLEESKTFLKLQIIQEDGKDKVRVSGLQDPYAQEDALMNEGEKKHLLNLLKDHECDEFISEESSKELLKIKKHYWVNMGSIGAEMFIHALQKLMTLHKLFELNSRGEVGQYFRSIMQDLEKKIVPKLQKRIQYMKHAISQTKELFDQTASHVLKVFDRKKKNLEDGLNFLLSKTQKDELPQNDPPPKPFPYYNWLENTI